MTLWVCKGGKRGERESRFRENNLVAIGFNLLNDLSRVQTKDELKSLYEKAWPDASEGALISSRMQPLSFGPVFPTSTVPNSQMKSKTAHYLKPIFCYSALKTSEN
jgi:hypothetical protein